MSETGNQAERTLVPAVANEANVLYTKLRPLNENETAKGIYTELPIGGSVSGIFLSSEVDNYGKTAYSIELASGKRQVVTQAGNLARQMAEITPGTYVQINYEGKKEMKSGQWAGKESHQFQVLKEQI